jgi:hypothetical protein
MSSKRKYSSGEVIAKLLSVLFHPLFAPVYGILIIFSAPTLFGYLPFAVKKIVFSIIVIDNVLVPLSLMPYFKYRKIISSWVIEERRERIIPLLATSFFYSFTVYIIYRFQLPQFIKSFVLAVAFIVIAVTVISFWWRISIHSVGAGTITALVATLSIKMHEPLTILLISVILASGLVLSSRLWLNSHNPKETWLGYLLGFAGSALFLLLL